MASQLYSLSIGKDKKRKTSIEQLNQLTNLNMIFKKDFMYTFNLYCYIQSLNSFLCFLKWNYWYIFFFFWEGMTKQWRKEMNFWWKFTQWIKKIATISLSKYMLILSHVRQLIAIYTYKVKELIKSHFSHKTIFGICCMKRHSMSHEITIWPIILILWKIHFFPGHLLSKSFFQESERKIVWLLFSQNMDNVNEFICDLYSITKNCCPINKCPKINGQIKQNDC